MYPVWSHIQQRVPAFEEILSFQIHAKSDTWKLICILSPVSEAICNNWPGALITFFHVKEFRSYQNCGFLKHRKIKTENEVNPVVVNCWMKNWNGGFVMCALHNEMNPHTPKQKKPNLFWWIFFTFLHHSLTFPCDSVNRANFWDPTNKKPLL